MLVERRKAQMPLLLQARVALVWLMISSILLVASLGLSAVQSTVPVDDLGPLIPLLGSIIERQLAIVVGLVALPLLALGIAMLDRKSTRLNSSHVRTSRMPSSA